MANAPLVDLDALDTSTVVFGPEEIAKVCKQRGRFAMLDGVVHYDLEGDTIVGFKDVRSGDWWAEDHIPGRPIFPGVLQIEAAAQLATFDFMHRAAEGPEVFVGFAGLNDTRFRGLVEPDCRLLLAARVHKIRRSMFVYRAQAFVEGKSVMECEILGVIL